MITSGSVVSVSVKDPESIRERLSKLTANERQMACLFDYGEGSFFGEASVLGFSKRAETVISKETTHLLALNHNEMVDLGTLSSRFKMVIHTLLVERMRRQLSGRRPNVMREVLHAVGLEEILTPQTRSKNTLLVADLTDEDDNGKGKGGRQSPGASAGASEPASLSSSPKGSSSAAEATRHGDAPGAVMESESVPGAVVESAPGAVPVIEGAHATLSGTGGGDGGVDRVGDGDSTVQPVSDPPTSKPSLSRMRSSTMKRMYAQQRPVELVEDWKHKLEEILDLKNENKSSELQIKLMGEGMDNVKEVVSVIRSELETLKRQEAERRSQLDRVEAKLDKLLTVR